MYLGTIARGATLGVRKDVKGPGSQQCQRCLQIGHWTYECKTPRAYVARPSRTKQMKNPDLRRFHNPEDQPPPLPGSKEEKELIRKELQRQIESKRAARKYVPLLHRFACLLTTLLDFYPAVASVGLC